MYRGIRYAKMFKLSKGIKRDEILSTIECCAVLKASEVKWMYMEIKILMNS